MFCIGCLVSSTSFASFPSQFSNYQEMRSWHVSFLNKAPSDSRKIEAYRHIVRSSQYGQRGLTRVLNNFEGGHSINPNIKGMDNVIRLLYHPVEHNRRGHMRELTYALSFDNDKRFSVVEMGRDIKTKLGTKTDLDVVFRYGKGLFGKIEVKDYSLTSQSTNFKSLASQIDKLASIQKETGQPQYWINRREVSPKIQEYANKKGIKTFGGVTTGKVIPKGGMSIESVKRTVASDITKIQRVRAAQSAFQVGYGASLLWSYAPKLSESYNTLRLSPSESAKARRAIGEYGSFSVAGGTMVAAGLSLSASTSRYASMGMQSKLYNFGKIGGTATYFYVASLVTGTGFKVYRYQKGDISSREFWESIATLSATAASGAAGAFVGTALGGAVGSLSDEALSTQGMATTGAFVGGVIGSAIGAEAGDRLTKSSFQVYYEAKANKMDQEYASFVYRKYGIN